MLANIYQYGVTADQVDGAVCNFALHYLCDTAAHVRNILAFNASILKVGGIYMFTVMDGRAIFDLLKTYKTGQQWEIREGGVVKYALKKLYSGQKIADVGQKISVLLPFSDEMYEEPLCNVKYIVDTAKVFGFRAEVNENMGSLLDKFGAADKRLADQLTDGDREYIALHRHVVLRLARKVDLAKFET
jgi:mRNA capping enzyme